MCYDTLLYARWALWTQLLIESINTQYYHTIYVIEYSPRRPIKTRTTSNEVIFHRQRGDRSLLWYITDRIHHSRCNVASFHRLGCALSLCTLVQDARRVFIPSHYYCISSHVISPPVLASHLISPHTFHLPHPTLHHQMHQYQGILLLSQVSRVNYRILG